MFKKGLLILTLCLSTIGLSGCGRSAKNGVEFVNNLDVEIQEITISQKFDDWANEGSEEEPSNPDDEEAVSYVLNITNNTKYYLNNMPIGIIVDDEQLTLDDLMAYDYETLDTRLILAPGDTFITEIRMDNADSKVTLIPDYNEKYYYRGVEEDLTTDSNIEELDSKFFDKYVTKESSDKMLYPSDITVGKATYVASSFEDLDGVIADLEVEITNNTDKDATNVKFKYYPPFFESIITDNECDGIVSYRETKDCDEQYFSLPANGKATAIFSYMGPEDVDGITIHFNGIAIK